jgi:hypothetical protein
VGKISPACSSTGARAVRRPELDGEFRGEDDTRQGRFVEISSPALLHVLEEEGGREGTWAGPFVRERVHSGFPIPL